jgi:uncharacterized membrane protein
MIRAHFKRLNGVPTIIALATGLLTAGCVTTGDIQGMATTGLSTLTGGTQPQTQTAAGASLTPAEQRMRQQSKAFQKTVWEGVLIGAGAGTLWGVIQGDKAKDVLLKAAIGGAVGGLAGAYIASKQKQFSSKEDQLDAMIADVRRSNQETEALIASVRQVIDEDKKRLAAVEQRYRKGQASQTEVADARRRITDNRAVIAQASTGAREKQTMFQGAERQYRQDNPGTDTKPMQRELEVYNRNLSTLDKLAGSVSVA